MKFRILRSQKRALANHVSIRHKVHEKPLAKPLPQPEPKPEADEEELQALSKSDIRAIKSLVRYYEKSIDYALMRNKPLRVAAINLLSGMAKGFGIAIGITVIAFLAFKILSSLDLLGLPIIGDFIAELLEYISNVQNMNL